MRSKDKTQAVKLYHKRYNDLDDSRSIHLNYIYNVKDKGRAFEKITIIMDISMEFEE
jgi:hypothetical protein